MEMFKTLFGAVLFVGSMFGIAFLKGDYVEDNATYSGDPIKQIIAQCEAELPRSQRCVVTAIVEEK